MVHSFQIDNLVYEDNTGWNIIRNQNIDREARWESVKVQWKLSETKDKIIKHLDQKFFK